MSGIIPFAGGGGMIPQLGYVGQATNAINQLAGLAQAGSNLYNQMPSMPSFKSKSSNGYKKKGNLRGRPKGSKNKTNATGKASNVKRNTKQVLTSQGAGLETSRQIQNNKYPREKKTFEKKVIKAVNKDKESQVKMFLLKNLNVQPGSIYDWEAYTVDTYYKRYSYDDLFYPTGLSQLETDPANVETAVKEGGLTIFPFNHVYRAGVSPTTFPETYELARFTKQSFNPISCAIDYGWIEGENYDRSYSRTEIVFGVIKNMKKFKEVMENNSWTIEKALNLILGNPGKVDLSINGSDWPLRGIGDATATSADDDQLFKDKRRLYGLVKILRRDTNLHRPIQAVTADGVDGVEKLDASACSRLFGSGSYTFPKDCLKKLELVDSEDYSGSQNIRNLAHKGQVPFIHIRGDVDPDATTPYLASSQAEAKKGMCVALRMKTSIVDDE